MKRLHIFLTGIILATIAACNSTDEKKNINVFGKKEGIEDSSNTNSLIFWTKDTIQETNLELVLLMDTLYQIVRSDGFISMPIERKLNWISNYRSQLGNYYDRNAFGKKRLSIFDKADTVILLAEKLWKLDQDGSSMGIINKNVIASDRNLFIEYNELQRLLDLFSSSVQEDALKKEFIAWHRLQDLFFNICSNLVGIHYYWGSAVGVINSYKIIELQNAHIELYKNDRMLMGLVNVIPDEGINDFINNRLIIEQLQKQCEIEEQYMKDNPEFYNIKSYELLDSIRKNVDRLPKILDEWLLKRNEYISHVNDELTYNQLIHNTDKALISMLAMIPTEN